MTPFFAGIDLGTSGCRLIVIDAENQIQSSTSVSYSNPDDQSPELWWNSVSQLLRELPSNIKTSLKSIAIDGTSGTILLCDDNGTPLSSTLMYSDLRATKEAELIKQALPENNGGQGASGSLARLLWILKHEINIETLGSAQNSQNRGGCASLRLPSGQVHIVHQADFILGKLAKNYTFSDENNCLKLGYDVHNQCWPIDELSTLGIPQSSLPKVFPAGTSVSRIDKKQANEFGLPEDLQLVTGTTDSIAAFIATGAQKQGDAVTSLGSTLVLKLISDKPIFSSEHGVYSHRLGDKWLVGGASNAGAKVLRHYFSQEQLDQMTPNLSPKNKTNLDYYPLTEVGERFPIADANKSGKLSPRPGNDVVFFQGILEGIAKIEAQAYKKLCELGAPAASSVRSVGGGCKNQAWTEIRENYLKVDMITPAQTEAAYGSALLAQQGYIKQ